MLNFPFPSSQHTLRDANFSIKLKGTFFEFFFFNGSSFSNPLHQLLLIIIWHDMTWLVVYWICFHWNKSKFNKNVLAQFNNNPDKYCICSRVKEAWRLLSKPDLPFLWNKIYYFLIFFNKRPILPWLFFASAAIIKTPQSPLANFTLLSHALTVPGSGPLLTPLSLPPV